eukprot:gene32679-17694_t
MQLFLAAANSKPTRCSNSKPTRGRGREILSRHSTVSTPFVTLPFLSLRSKACQKHMGQAANVRGKNWAEKRNVRGVRQLCASRVPGRKKARQVRSERGAERRIRWSAASTKTCKPTDKGTIAPWILVPSTASNPLAKSCPSATSPKIRMQ